MGVRPAGSGARRILLFYEQRDRETVEDRGDRLGAARPTGPGELVGPRACGQVDGRIAPMAATANHEAGNHGDSALRTREGERVSGPLPGHDQRPIVALDAEDLGTAP